MADVLLQCEKKTLGFDLFEWKEYVSDGPRKRGGSSKFLRGKHGLKIKVETVTRGKPEDA